MTQRIPWSRVLAEGAVIVLSILMAFGIDSAWDEYRERRQEVGQLEALHRDFVENRERLDSVIVWQTRNVEAQIELISVTHGLAPTPDVDSLRVLFSLGTSFARFKPVTGAYEALTSSGNIGLISSDELRLELAAWVGTAAGGYEDEDASTITRLALLQATSPHLQLLSLLSPPMLDYLGVGPAGHPSSLQELVSDRKFSNLLVALAFTERNILDDYFEPLRVDANRVLALIEQQLSR